MQTLYKNVACCYNGSQAWLVVHMIVLAMFDMLAYSMCLVPIVVLLRKISFANGKQTPCVQCKLVGTCLALLLILQLRMQAQVALLRRHRPF